MTLILNRAKETSTTQGQGTYQLLGPSAGFQSLAAAAAEISGDGSGPWVIDYVVEDGTGWEIGRGTLTDAAPDTLSRDSIEESSNAGAAVDWGSGVRNVFSAVTAKGVSDLIDGQASNGFIEQTAARTYSRVAPPIPIAKGGTGAATAGAALTALGFSAFIKTLIDDADSAAARATLEIPALQFTTGDVKLTMKTSADSGWLMMDDADIGDTGSGATHAGPQYEDLWKLLYDNVIDTWCPVSGGRSSRDADWSAGKRLTLNRTLGRALAVSGGGTGLTTRVLGEYLGTETVSLTGAQTGPHNHDVSLSEAIGLGSRAARSDGAHQVYESTTTDGDGNPHNNMEPSSFFNVMIKL